MRNAIRSGIALPVLALVLAGCQVRSISSSGYGPGGFDTPELYRGELHELDILGIEAGDRADDASGDLTLERNQSVLLIQSGALMPDPDMLYALGEHFRVGTMSGIPRQPGEPSPSHRVAAARGGHDAIVCYWGILESARAATGGKAVSWVPIAGFFVPDEDQRIRIRLKVAVVDVATGSWRQLLPTPSENIAASSFVSRESSDQEQVAAIKREGYRTAVRELVSAFVR